MADGTNMLSSLLDNRSANFARRKKMEADASQAELAATLDRLESQRQAILANEGGYSPEMVQAFLGDLDKNIAYAKAKAQPSNMLETIASQTLGGQILSDVMTPADSDQKTFERNNALASLIPAVASLSPRGVSTLPGRAAKSVGRVAAGAAKRVASVGGTGAEALGQAEKLSGAALKSTAKAGMTATREEMAAAAPYIAQAGGDFEAGMRAFKAAQTNGGKNVAIPSSSAAGPASSPAPSPSGAGNRHVPPRAASGAAPAPTPAPAAANVASPSSSTLKRLLAIGSAAGGSAMLASGLMDLFNGAEQQVANQSAEESILRQRPLQGMPTLPTQPTQESAPQVQAPTAQPAQPAQQPDQLNQLIMQLLTQQGGGEQATQPQGLISDTDIAQIKKLVDTIAPQQQVQAEPEKKQSVLVGILDALGKGLIAGGTGDPNAAFVLENQARQEALTQEQLRRSKQELNPQQQFVNQILSQVLGNRMSVSGQKEINAAQNQNAMQQQGRQIAAQLLMLEREQRNALARNDVQYGQQLELQKRELAARLEQIKAQTTGQLQFMLNPEIQKLLSGMGGLGGGNNQPIVNQ